MGFEEIPERWHVIDNFEDYAVTESGKVYSKNEYRIKGLRKLAIKGINNPKRYLQVTLCKANKEHYAQVHQLVGRYFVDGYFEGAEIDHKDNNKHNNHYTNLEWVTHRENMRRSYIIVNQVRNYKLWNIIYPDGTVSPVLKGCGEIAKYVYDNHLDILMSMILKHKKHRGYKLVGADGITYLETQTTIRKE